MGRLGMAAALLCLLVLSRRVAADDGGGPRLGREVTQRWQIGVMVQATQGAVTGITATMPVPMDWPEQKVRIVSEDVTRNVKSVRYRTIEGGVQQMLVVIPRLAPGESAKALITFEVTKHFLEPPAETRELRIPETLSRELRQYMTDSPYIEVRDPVIQGVAEKAAEGKVRAWEKAESMFDWVRENIEYRFDVKIKGALKAVEDGYGDCEELTSLFVAMCRNHGIPARAVWIPDHCYPEFYLEDAQGVGHWYPCQAAGDRAFGGMPEAKPILQKGDNFRVPGQRAPQRYVAESLQAKNAVSNPSFEFIRRQVTE